MFEGMGIQWASTLLGCIAALLVPVPIWFYLKGAKIREKSAYAPTAPSATVAEETEEK
jgi:DHA1 family multidrug resistance protein-like MFS transporter